MNVAGGGGQAWVAGKEARDGLGPCMLHKVSCINLGLHMQAYMNEETHRQVMNNRHAQAKEERAAQRRVVPPGGGVRGGEMKKGSLLRWQPM